MAHDGNFAIDQGAHHFHALGPALEFHCICTSLQESSGVAYRLLRTEVKAKKRHIGHEQGTGLVRATASR